MSYKEGRTVSVRERKNGSSSVWLPLVVVMETVTVPLEVMRWTYVIRGEGTR